MRMVMENVHAGGCLIVEEDEDGGFEDCCCYGSYGTEK